MGNCILNKMGGASKIVNGIIEEYLAESEDISANTFVDFVSVHHVGQSGSYNTNATEYLNDAKATVLDDNTIFLCFSVYEGYWSFIRACVVRIYDNNSFGYYSILDLGTSDQHASSNGGLLNGFACTRISQDTVLVAYNNQGMSAECYIIMCSIDSTYTITKGTAVKLQPPSPHQNYMVPSSRWIFLNLSDGRAVLFIPDSSSGIVCFVCSCGASNNVVSYESFYIEVTKNNSFYISYINDTTFVIVSVYDNLVSLCPLFYTNNNFVLGVKLQYSNTDIPIESDKLYLLTLDDRKTVCLLFMSNDGKTTTTDYRHVYAKTFLINNGELSVLYTDCIVSKDVNNILFSYALLGDILYVCCRSYLLSDYVIFQYKISQKSVQLMSETSLLSMTSGVTFSNMYNSSYLFCAINGKILVTYHSTETSKYKILQNLLIESSLNSIVSDGVVKGLTLTKATTTTKGKVWLPK